MSDRRVNALVLAAIFLGLLWAYFFARQPPVASPRPLPVVAPEMVPLVTGEEPTALIFRRAGCPVCHRIPGIAGADGRVGPPLWLGTTGLQRLRDPAYRGKAKTVHEYIVESAKSLSKRFENCVWLFVGDGNLSEHFKQQVRGLGLQEKIKFTGLLPPSQIPLAIHSSDILVHCSLREGLARTLPQAMLCAKPAISFDVDGAREVVNENTGRLIEPKNVAQLIDACTELIKDRGLRERLGQQGRQSVVTKFAPETMVDTIEAVYRKLLGRD